MNAAAQYPAADRLTEDSPKPGGQRFGHRSNDNAENRRRNYGHPEDPAQVRTLALGRHESDHPIAGTENYE
ncbi:MAG: hypothetical protein WA938_05585 [Candidatus Dormiibacterota bacterium]